MIQQRGKPDKQTAWLIALTIPLALGGIVAIGFSIPSVQSLKLPLQWFDPIFFQYNVLLFMVLVLIIPAITYFYVDTMRDERFTRLRLELPESVWAQQQEHIGKGIDIQFGLKNYVGSTATLMIIVAMGFAVMLLLKPMPDALHGLGVDYGKGANLLLMGPDIELLASDSKYYHRLIVSLTAFQFGFLGGYVFFVLHLVRSYFTLDLTPNTFVNLSVRMVVGSLTALVVSFLPIFPGSAGIAVIPVVSFFIGFFPSKGMLAIEKAASRLLRLALESYPSRPLSCLSGMSADHEMRLRREGYDNLENLAQADPIGLAIRTGCGYRQISEWIGQAWLWNHMGEDYAGFKAASGISTADDFAHFLKSWRATHQGGDPYGFLNSAKATEQYSTKIRVIGELLAPFNDPAQLATGKVRIADQQVA